MESQLDILDMLEGETGFVRLVLSTGKIVYGRPEIICLAEDDEGYDTIEEIMFAPYFNPNNIRYFYRKEDIKSYEPCDEAYIPPKQELI